MDLTPKLHSGGYATEVKIWQVFVEHAILT